MEPIDEIDEIPVNIFVREKFIDSLRSNKAIAFVGAGVTIELYKSWSDLLKFLGNETKTVWLYRTGPSKLPLRSVTWLGKVVR